MSQVTASKKYGGITKVLFDFLNRRSFENWNSKTERDLRGQIVKFLDSVQGANRLIEKFKVIRFEQDPNQNIKRCRSRVWQCKLCSSASFVFTNAQRNRVAFFC